MDSRRNPRNKFLGLSPGRGRLSRKALRSCILLAFLGEAGAADLRIQPIFFANEQYSDNIYLAPDKATANTPNSRTRQSSLVTMLSPGIYATRTGPWSFSLYYQLQGIFYTGKASSVNFNNQLGFSSHGEILDNSLFLSANSNIGQYNNAGAFGRGVYAVDNISRTGTTNTYQVFRVNPYWTPHLGGYVDGVVGLSYAYTTTGSNSSDGGIGASNNVSEYINLYNGKEFTQIGWRLNFFQQDMFSDGGNVGVAGSGDVTYRNYSGQISYRLWEHVRPFVQAGVYENSFANVGTVNGANNGSYWNVGVIWTPSQKTYLQVGAGGNNYFANLRWSPSKRTELLFSFRDSDVGGAYGGYGSYGGVGGYGGGFSGAGGGLSGVGGVGGVGGYGGGVGGLGGYGGGLGGMGGYGDTVGNNSAGSDAQSGSGSQGSARSGACSGGTGNFGGGAGALGATGGYNTGMGGYGGGLGGGIGGYGSGFGSGIGGYGGVGGTSGFGSGLTGLGGGSGGYGVGVGGLGGGLNTYGGFNSGTTWNGGVCHRTRRTQWQAIYTEYTTTTSQIFQDTQQAYIPISQPTNATNINEIITRKRAQASVSLLYPKTNITLSGYQERANYQSNGNQDVLGVTAFWNWRFAKQTSSQLMVAWQSLNAKPTSSPQYSSDFSMISLGVYHTISKYVSGGLTYRYTEQSSDLLAASYSENRVMANLFLRY
ncbi:hypothetical protein [Methylomagnum sp.]